MRFLAAATFAYAAAACGGHSPPPTKSTLVELRPIGPSGLSAISPTRITDRPAPNITASLLTYSGDGFWGNVTQPTQPLSELLRPCYEVALRQNPETAGWLFVHLDLAKHEATLKDSSPLPNALVGCVVGKLAEVELANGMIVEQLSVYVSLSLGD